MKSIFLISTLVILNVNTCSRYRDPNCNDQSHRSSVFINKSNKNVCFHFYWNYPDTLIGAYKAYQPAATRGVQYPGDSLSISAGPRGCCCFESNYANGRKEWIYIFDVDTLKVVPWEIVRKTNRGLLERRLIDLDYLRANDFQIIYK